MKKYYTRACNFTHGKKSVNLVKKKINLPLRGNNKISFNEIEIISRNSKKTIQIKDVKNLPKFLKANTKIINNNKKLVRPSKKNMVILGKNKIKKSLNISTKKTANSNMKNINLAICETT